MGAVEHSVDFAVAHLRTFGRETAAHHLRFASEALSQGNRSGAVSQATNAVECVLGDITGEAITLGKYLDKHPSLFHPALRKALDGIYDVASDSGARHGKEGIQPGLEEAQFAVTTCVAVCTLISSTNRKLKIEP
jgi:hypothetical protein